MTIRSPYQTLHRISFSENSYSRETFHETLGACWALSCQNVSGMFPIQLRLNLYKVHLLYGIPGTHLPNAVFEDFIRTFQHRPQKKHNQSTRTLEINAQQLINSMNKTDFLHFFSGFQEAVVQILECSDDWTQYCHHHFMALNYAGLALIEQEMGTAQQRATYIQLFTKFLLLGQQTFTHALHTHPHY